MTVFWLYIVGALATAAYAARDIALHGAGLPESEDDEARFVVCAGASIACLGLVILWPLTCVLFLYIRSMQRRRQ